MNKLYLAMVLLLLLPICTGFYAFTVASRCEELGKMVEDIYESAEKNMDEEKFRMVEKEWESLETTLTFSINHSEIDDIKESLSKGRAHMENGNTGGLRCEMMWLKMLLNHVSEMEMPVFENIF